MNLELKSTAKAIGIEIKDTDSDMYISHLICQKAVYLSEQNRILTERLALIPAQEPVNPFANLTTPVETPVE